MQVVGSFRLAWLSGIPRANYLTHRHVAGDEQSLKHFFAEDITITLNRLRNAKSNK
jgi:hypothetical protein